VLPTTIGDLHKLESIDTSHNQLQPLPTTIGDLRLVFMSVSHNQLESLPASIGSLHALQFLYASHNRLTSLPATIGNAHELERIDVSDNDLIDLPDSMRDLSKLHTLDVSSNQIGCLAYRLSLPSCPSCVRSMRRATNFRISPNHGAARLVPTQLCLLQCTSQTPSRARDPQRPAQRAVWIAGECRTT
jgi:Leucine-rich repeat (LRR) protein